MSERNLIRDVAFVAVAWRVADEQLKQILSRETDAALAGAKEAVEVGAADWWHVSQFVDCFTLEQLEAAGMPDRVIESKRRDIAAAEARTGQAAMGPYLQSEATATVEGAAVSDDLAEDPQRPLTLSELLAKPRDQFDEIIAHHSQAYGSQVKDLSEDEANDLRQRLREWWPDKPYKESITWNNAHRWTQENMAAAWIWFGPALDMDVTPQQWAELAVSGVLFQDQTEWLWRHCTDEAKRILAAICDASDTRIWTQVFNSTPGPFPDELVDAVVRHLRTAEREEYGVGYVGGRLIEDGRIEAVYALAAVSDEFARALRPLLAKEGDVDAQRPLLDELANELRAGKRPERHDLTWLESLDSEELLPQLFEILKLTYGPSRGIESTVGDDVAWLSVDVATPVMTAIRTIGGPRAVEGYDRLLEESEDFRFLRLQRDAIVQSMLQMEGLDAAPQAARELGLPVLSPFE